ncbi:MAG: hypothetical protein IKF91_00395 [Bacilli bacterium]|nr:hypothetical protein [Bacilli bacterium]
MLVIGIGLYINNKRNTNIKKENTNITEDKQKEQIEETTNNDSTNEIASEWQKYNFEEGIEATDY